MVLDVSIHDTLPIIITFTESISNNYITNGIKIIFIEVSKLRGMKFL